MARINKINQALNVIKTEAGTASKEDCYRIAIHLQEALNSIGYFELGGNYAENVRLNTQLDLGISFQERTQVLAKQSVDEAVRERDQKILNLLDGISQLEGALVVANREKALRGERCDRMEAQLQGLMTHLSTLTELIRKEGGR